MSAPPLHELHGVYRANSSKVKKLNFSLLKKHPKLGSKELEVWEEGHRKNAGEKVVHFQRTMMTRSHKQKTWGKCSHPWENHGEAKEKEETASKEKRETVWGQCDRGRSGWTQHLRQSYFLKGIGQISYALHINRSEGAKVDRQKIPQKIQEAIPLAFQG